MLSNRRSLLGPSPTEAPNWKRATWNKRASSFTVGSTLAGTIHENSVIGDPQAEPHCISPSVLTTTTSDLPGYKVVKVIGSVYGCTTCALPKDGKALMKNARTGAEVKILTHVLYSARDLATERMVVDCVTRGGNAIVGMSFGDGEVVGCMHVSVNGTAVYIEPA